VPIESCSCAFRPHPEGPPPAGVSKDGPQSNDLNAIALGLTGAQYAAASRSNHNPLEYWIARSSPGDDT